MEDLYPTRVIEVFIQVLRCVVRQTIFCFPDDFGQYEKSIILLANRQEVSHLFYSAYMKAKRVIPKELEHAFLLQVGRDKKNQFMFKKVKDVFQKEGIKYVPLKGAVTKEIYPESWMRSGCDIDILVQETSLDEAVNALVKEGFSTDFEIAFHDVAFYFGGARLELHYNICENLPRVDKVLSEVWEHVVSLDMYEYRETPEFLAFHTIIHLMYHFLKGGCQIKAFIDLWLMKSKKIYDEEKLLLLLKQCSLERFYSQICGAIEVWFDGKESSRLSLQLANWVFAGGMAGIVQQSEKADIVLNGGTIKYIWCSLFLPYSDMQWIYPNVKRFPWLLPYYYGRRFFTKIFGVDRQKTRRQIYEAIHIKDEQNMELIELMSKLGLD